MTGLIIGGAALLLLLAGKKKKSRTAGAGLDLDPGMGPGTGSLPSNTTAISRDLKALGYDSGGGMELRITNFQIEWNYFVREMIPPMSGYEILDVDGLPGPKTRASIKLALLSESLGTFSEAVAEDH